ncbi:LL-diaminopimelate aminotransferase [Treponema sp. OMZ 840]|uniref:LL-diaminopimelate aminotransferase n=1 Tax=Treponema sp. OMZ 840 TaxID=244313 RepID=UPI003D8FF515
MIKRNPAFQALKAGYLFPEIASRRKAFEVSHPEAKIISLGIGNTTEPLTPHISSAMADYSRFLSTREGYSGYGDEQGLKALRSKIAETLYAGTADESEIFISDGAKCDIGRIQLLFGADVGVAVQDPAYPVYVDGSVIIGAASSVSAKAEPCAKSCSETSTGAHTGYAGIVYMPCTAENGFFPDLSVVPENSLIYFCSPNNPTGAVATKEQLKKLVDCALQKGCVIIFDAAYSAFIRDDSLPKSIYEVEGARRCAIEINSFSKPAGFTGVRLGWSVVPKTLVYEDGTPVINDWNRIMTTVFNGASNIAQRGGLAALDETGLKEMRSLTDFYLENARLIKACLQGGNFNSMGVRIYGADNAPYVWAQFPGKKSWHVFDEILKQCRTLTTPGSGFGPSGESFIRFSAFGSRSNIQEACTRLSSFAL